MLSREENELICRTSPGTPMGELFRRFWLPVALAEELPGPDCDPVRVQVLGEHLVLFRDTQGRPGLVDAYCPHRGAPCSLAAMKNVDCGVCTTAGSSMWTATASICPTYRRARLLRPRQAPGIPGGRGRRFALGVHGTSGQKAPDARLRLVRPAAHAPVCEEVPARMQLPPGHGGRLRRVARQLSAQHPRPGAGQQPGAAGERRAPPVRGPDAPLCLAGGHSLGLDDGLVRQTGGRPAGMRRDHG